MSPAYDNLPFETKFRDSKEGDTTDILFAAAISDYGNIQEATQHMDLIVERPNANPKIDVVSDILKLFQGLKTYSDLHRNWLANDLALPIEDKEPLESNHHRKRRKEFWDLKEGLKKKDLVAIRWYRKAFSYAGWGDTLKAELDRLYLDCRI